MLPILAMIAARLIYKAISSGVAAAGKAGNDIADAVNNANEQRAWNERAKHREEQDRAARARPTDFQEDPLLKATLVVKSHEGSLKVAQKKAAESPTVDNIAEVERWGRLLERSRERLAIQEQLQAATLSNAQAANVNNRMHGAGIEADPPKNLSAISSEETAKQSAMRLVEEKKRSIAAESAVEAGRRAALSYKNELRSD